MSITQAQINCPKCGTPIVNYAVQLDKRLYRTSFLEVSSGVAAEVGSYRTNGVLNARVELGRFISPFTMPVVQDGKLRISISLTGDVRAVAHDATLQGALIGDASPYVLPASAISRTVLRGGWEAKLSYKRTQLSFNRIYLTHEFTNGLPHGWGGINLRWVW